MRTGLLALACLVVGFLGGTWLAERPVGAPDILAIEPSAVETPAAPRLAGREPPSPDEEVVPVAPPNAETEAAPSPADEDAGVAARVQVTVVYPPGTKQRWGTIYALPAGSTGVDDLAWVPHADMEGETGIVALPRAGTWDVGYAGVLGAALAEGIRVAPGAVAPVRLMLPPRAPITISYATRAAADWARGRNVHVVLRTIRVPNEHRYPGRGEVHKLARTTGLHADRPTVLTPLPSHREVELSLRYKAEPKEEEARDLSRRRPWPRWKLRLREERVRPGAEVHVALVEQAQLHVAFALRGRTEHPWSNELGLHVGVSVKRDGEVLGRMRVGVWGGKELRSGRTFVWADPGPATLFYGGPCCKPGRVDGIQLVAGETTRIEVPIDLDPDFRYEAPTPTTEHGFSVHFEGIRSADEHAELAVYAADPESGRDSLTDADVDLHRFDPSQEDEGFRAVGDDWEGVRWVAGIHGPDKAAAAVMLDAHTEEIVLTLAPAGHLCVVPGRWSGNSMGDLILRRTDGKPSPISSWEDAGSIPEFIGAARSVSVHVGLMLGPLLPGTYTFDVLRGRTPVGRVTGTVRAGRIEVLRIPH